MNLYACLELILAAIAVVASTAAWRRGRHLAAALRGAEAARDQALAAEAVATRILRLSAGELREVAMTLVGHAGRLAAAEAAAPGPDPADPGRDADITAIRAATSQVLRLADDLQDHAVGAATTRVLKEEMVRLGPLLDEAIVTVTASLGSSRRHWRLEPEIAAQALIADRRALRQVLVRVLSNAARFSRHDDSVDVSLEHLDDGIALVVEDEGAGVMAPDHGSPAQLADTQLADTRGIGLGLTLARSLMEAHGGRLIIESAARVGTRVALVLPANRVAPAQLPA